jgi:hypothetical protein
MMLNNQKVGILRVILQKEQTTQTILHGNIARECAERGIRPLTKSQISHFCFGDKPDSKISTYLKLLIGINAVRRRPEPYTLDEIIEKDEIIESLKS